MNDEIKKAIKVLKSGGVIAYPTDTLFGLGCDATNEEAVQKLITLKKRNNKPMSIACSSVAMIERYAEMEREAKKIIDSFLPGPYTFLLNKKDTISDLVTFGSKVVGVRIPDYPKILNLIDLFGKPITSTSANVAGESDIKKLDELKLGVDYILEGECKYKKASTVVDIVHKKILRKGVGTIEINQALRDLI